MRSIEILIIDDNPADSFLMKEFLLERYLTTVTVVQDGEEALRLLVTPGYTPDLILLDLKLPKMSGHEAAKRIRRKLTARVPIVILSGSQNPDDISFAYAVGVNAYVEKPTDMDALLRMMQSVGRLWVEPLVRDVQFK